MTISLTQLLLALVLLPFLWVIIDWFFSYFAEWRAQRHHGRSARECHLCGKLYPEGRRVKLSTCPDCAAQNVRGGHRKLG